MCKNYLITIVLLAGLTGILYADNIQTLDNGQIRLRVNCTAGGIPWRLVESNLSDTYSYVSKGSADDDYGREFQITLSDGHNGILQPPIPWNPTQGGDVYRNPSPVNTWYNNGYEIYVQSNMRDWMPTTPAVTPVVLEIWYRLDGKTVRVRGNVINYENHDRWWTGSEFPSTFLKTDCNIWRYGDSSDPWNINAATPYVEKQWSQVTEYTNDNPAWEHYDTDEQWAGWYTQSNHTQAGAGITTVQTDGGMGGSVCRVTNGQGASGGPDDDQLVMSNFSCFANLPAYSIRRFEHTWVVGTVSDARTWVHNWHSNTSVVKPTDMLYYAFDSSRSDYLHFLRQTGYWTQTSGVFQTQTFQVNNPSDFNESDATIRGRTMANGTIEADVQITSTANTDRTNYVGLALRKPAGDTLSLYSGYQFRLRYDGVLEFYCANWNFYPYWGVIQSVQTNMPPTTKRHMKVVATGTNFKIYIDGVLKGDWTESSNLYPDGYFGLHAYAGTATYDNVRIKGSSLDSTENHYTNQGSVVHRSMSGGKDVGQKFTAENSFNTVRVQCSGTVSTSMRLRLYAWNTDYSTTVAGVPLANSVLASSANPCYLTLNAGGTRSAGTYVLRMSDSSGDFGPDGFNNSNDTEAIPYLFGARRFEILENLFASAVTGCVSPGSGIDLAAHIMPLEPFSSLGFIFTDKGAANDSAPFTLKFYRWYTNYSTTVSGNPLVTQSFSQGYGNGDFWVDLDIGGEYDTYGYLVVMHLDSMPSGTDIGWYLNSSSTETRAEYYANGTLQTGDLYLYTQTANMDYIVETLNQ